LPDRSAGRDGTERLQDIETLAFADGEIAAPTAGPGATLQVRAYAWKSHELLSGVVIEPAPASGGAGLSGVSASSPSGPDGRAQLGGLPDGVFGFSARRAVPEAETPATQDAVTLQDAVAILRLIAGQPVNPGGRPLSPYQAHAADFDANGTVSLADALGVLRHAVGLPSPQPAWAFFDESSPALPQTQATSPGAPPALQATLPASATLGLVGVLRGDVDDSWVPPPGSQDLDTAEPAYFTSLLTGLTAAHPGAGFALSQWGVYGD
jgi:hypothetical protein